MTQARGSSAAVDTWPDVSIATSQPPSRSRVTHGNAPGCESGSPPVRQRRRAGKRRSSSSTSSSLRFLPSWNAYAVSHQTQRSGQPVSRRNTDGRPARVPSPWIEKKISLTVSTALRASLGVAGAAARRFPDANAHELLALGAERPLHLAEEVARHGLGRRALAGEVGVRGD